MSNDVRDKPAGRWFWSISWALATVVCVGAVATGPAEAAPTASLVYSTNGGATWSRSANAAPGQTVLVRAFFNNDRLSPLANASTKTTLPAGFALVAGSTTVCLSPGTTDVTAPGPEQVCNTDAGQGGPINEASVWSGGHLTLGGAAGLFGQSTGQTVGVLPAGEKRYLRVVNCDYRNGTEHYTSSISTTALSAFFEAGTSASNTPLAAAPCGPGALGYTPYTQNSGVQNIALTGRRSLVLQNCDFVSGVDHYTDSISTTPQSALFGAGTNASNTIPATPTCGPGGGGYSFVPSNSGTQAMDLVSNRYLHLENCTYSWGGDVYTDSISTTPQSAALGARTRMSNRASVLPRCHPGGSHTLEPLSSGVQHLDLRDTSRGQGYVQFQVRAPSPAVVTTYHQTSSLTASGVAVSSTGTITIDPSIGTPVVDPTVLTALAGVGLFGITIARVRRRGRSRS